MIKNLVSIGLLSLSFSGHAGTLFKPVSGKLSYVLNNMVSVYQNEKDFDWGIRIFRVTQPDECMNGANSCAEEVLYIAISDINAAPEQKLFVLRSAYQWDVDSVQENAKLLPPDGCIEVSVKEKIKNQKTNELQFIRHRLCVNTSKIIEIK